MRPTLEHLESRELLAVWSEPMHITYSLTYLRALGDLPRDVVRAEAREAIKLFDTNVPGVKLYQVSGSGANIDLHVETIDGPGGLWGWGQYPPDGRISIDPEEDWDLNMIRWILLHETGHALGLQHTNDTRDVMYPYYNEANPVLSLSNNDVATALVLYPSKKAAVVTQPDSYQAYLQWYETYLRWYHDVFLPWWYATH